MKQINKINLFYWIKLVKLLLLNMGRFNSLHI
nr:MAG TPA: hypothetical protein [Caudoviricetes sp.]